MRCGSCSGIKLLKLNLKRTEEATGGDQLDIGIRSYGQIEASDQCVLVTVKGTRIIPFASSLEGLRIYWARTCSIADGIPLVV